MFVVAIEIDAHAHLTCHLLREVDGEAILAVKPECRLPADEGSPLVFCILYRVEEQEDPAIQGPEEAFFFFADHFRHLLLVACQLRESTRHDLHDGWDDSIQKRAACSEVLTTVPFGTAENTLEHIFTFPVADPRPIG